MRAFILTNEGKFNMNHRKEKYFSKAYIGVAVVEGDILQPVYLRLYDTPSRAYACVWVRGYRGKEYIDKKGSGFAGGCGYHMASAAAEIAINNAGIELSESISGTGDGAIRSAVEAIMRAVYPDAEVMCVVEA